MVAATVMFNAEDYYAANKEGQHGLPPRPRTLDEIKVGNAKVTGAFELRDRLIAQAKAGGAGEIDGRA